MQNLQNAEGLSRPRAIVPCAQHVLTDVLAAKAQQANSMDSSGLSSCVQRRRAKGLCRKEGYESIYARKEVVYVVPVKSVLGRLPIVLAGDTGTIPFKYRAGLHNGGHRYNHNLARADLAPGAADGYPMYFVNFGHVI